MADFKWYAIQTYAGSEMSVKGAIENIFAQLGSEDKLQEIIVPTEDVITEALVILHLFLNKCKVSGIFTLTVHSLCRLV